MILVYSYYVLDVVHKGHLLYMKNAKALAGKDGRSIVGILTDKAVMERKLKPILPFDERIEIAQSIKYADLVLVQDTYSPLKNIKRILPNILIESSSHEENKEVLAFMGKIGGRIFIFPYYLNQSSTKIKEKIRSV